MSASPDDQRIGFGLIGLGTIHTAHAQGYREASARAAIVAVCDEDCQLVKHKATEFVAAGYSDYRRLLEDPAVQAVDISLPHNLHYPVARAALEAGKHVAVEKPLAITSSECLELIELAERLHLQLTVLENTRFVEAYLEVERIVRAEILGEVRLVRTFIFGSEVSRLRNEALWKGRREGSGGGAIIDAGVHSFFLLKWLFGEIRSVAAFSAKLVAESEVEDHATVVGELAGGGVFSSEFTFTAEIPWGERLEVYGARGSLIVDQLVDPPAVHFRGAYDYSPTALDVRYDPVGWKSRSIAAGIEDFSLALHEGRAPSVDPRDGYYAVHVAERAYASLDEDGRRQVI